MALPTGVLRLSPEDHAFLGEAEFGTPGLVAVESIGPFTRVRACGPLVTVHDSVIAAGLGIGHHPHRYHERLFYLERGTFDHDDARNGISGHVPEGALARFTEGRGGMIHQEWNHGEVDAEIYILVATTVPIPEQTSFEVLRREDMPVYPEAAGVVTREMVGPRSPLPVHCDVRSFTDTTLQPGAGVRWALGAGEGGLLSVRAGAVDLEGARLGPRWTALLPPAPEARVLALEAPPGARVIRAAFGPGYGLVVAD
jgi:redox-sensitive bicupin YhaK (pirin superfamily)